MRLALAAHFLACRPQANGQQRIDLPESAFEAEHAALERPHPRLDWPRHAESPPFVGVELLQGAVRLSRPRSWVLRDASDSPGAAYAHYVSPRGYSFSIYQRRATPGVPWRDILRRYEERLTREGVPLTPAPSVLATARGDGRLYSFRLTAVHNDETLAVDGRCIEMLLRGRSRLVLVQVVHQGQELSGTRGELLRALSSLEVH